MKKAFLFLLSIMVLTISCSSDDAATPQSDDTIDGNGLKTLTVTINGVTKTFNTIVVQGPAENWGVINQYLMVEATINNSPLEILQFNFYTGLLGSNVINDFSYTTNGEQYFFYDLQHVVTVNSQSRFFGSFLGTSSGEQVTLTNGTFDINK